MYIAFFINQYKTTFRIVYNGRKLIFLHILLYSEFTETTSKRVDFIAYFSYAAIERMMYTGPVVTFNQFINRFYRFLYRTDIFIKNMHDKNDQYNELDHQYCNKDDIIVNH